MRYYRQRVIMLGMKSARVKETPQEHLRKCAEQCKALKGKSVSDVIASPEFLENLGKYWAAQREDYAAAVSTFKATAKPLQRMPAHPITHFLELDAEGMRQEFAKCVGRTSLRPRSQREYIEQLGMQAYNVTVANALVAEFPELKDILFPKSKQN